jgi:hypothetical protein
MVAKMQIRLRTEKGEKRLKVTIVATGRTSATWKLYLVASNGF